MDSTLIKGLGVLEALVRRDAESSVTELANELGLVRSNVHRTLQTLVHAGYVEQLPDSARYRPRLRLWELGMLVERRHDIRVWARPFLERLTAKTGETTVLGVLEGREIIYLDKVESPHPVGAFVHVGMHAPFHCTAPGKAMLAFSPPSVLETLPPTFARFTPTTITKRSDWIETLDDVRRRGYAINLGEWRSGVNSAAAPIFVLPNKVLAAIAVSGPDMRVTAKELRKIGPEVVEAAQAISERLASQ